MNSECKNYVRRQTLVLFDLLCECEETEGTLEKNLDLKANEGQDNEGRRYEDEKTQNRGRLLPWWGWEGQGQEFSRVQALRYRSEAQPPG